MRSATRLWVPLEAPRQIVYVFVRRTRFPSDSYLEIEGVGSKVSFDGGFIENFMTIKSMPYYQILLTWQITIMERKGKI